MGNGTAVPVLAPEPAELAARLLDGERRLLLVGEPGAGKSTLTRALAARLAAVGRRSQCITADPGSPAFGVPGAVTLAEWNGTDWQPRRLEALCALDAARFRLPLTTAVGRLTAALQDAPLLLDAPGLVRGVPAAELLEALVAVAAIDAVLLVARSGRPPLLEELAALPVPAYRVPAAEQAYHAGKEERAERRTRLWDRYLTSAHSHTLRLDRLRLIGTPLPCAATAAWAGRQVALLSKGRTVALGEVEALVWPHLRLRAPALAQAPDAVLMRDAGRDQQGWLRTRKPPASEAGPGVTAAAPRLRLGAAEVELVNGLTGDPLLHLRLPQRRRSLLFDLGESGRLPAALVHQVTDVFISHAHLDHIGGFIWLLRTRMGPFPPCRLYGPPGLAGHIDGLLRGILWDRIGDEGPEFEIHELHGACVRRFLAKAGKGCRRLDERPLQDDAVLSEAEFRVRAVALDHQGTPSLAYAYEPVATLNVDTAALRARGLAPGPWLGELKHRVLQGRLDGSLQLPTGNPEPAAELARSLLHRERGRKLAYATDFGDTPANRRRLAELAQGADLLVCEASFRVSEQRQAERTGHLTTRACAEIAQAAQVRRLLPFHFSRRYEKALAPLLAEVTAVFARTVPIRFER